jgi:3-hydroxyisobutyrate dehydrogenase
MKYGYIGLGNLGGHLAASLLQAGFDLTVYDKNPALAERHLALGARWAYSPMQLATEVDAVLTCLPSPMISELVLQDLIAAAKPNLHWLEMSTLGRDEIQHLAKQADEAGIKVLESPVTGGVHLAAQGKITVIVGGEQALFEQHRPAFEAMGDKIFYMGALGSAAIIKVVTNMLAFIHLVADGEALMLAKRGGLDLAQAWAVIKASSGNSFVHETEGQLILNGSYDIAFTMDLALKDLGFALNFGREFEVPLDLASVTQQTFVKGRAAYGGQAQSTQIVKLLEDVLQTDLRAAGFPSRLE